MKCCYILIVFSIIIFSTDNLKAQTIWTGVTTTFSEPANADWTLQENQDRITDNVWITRKNTQGIYTVFNETGYSNPISPSGTAWTYGTTANIDSLTYDNWKTTIGGNPPNMVNQDMVLYILSDDVYIDIKFTSWSAGAGGGFGYQRSANQTLGGDDIAVDKNVKLFPNPANNTIKILGISNL